MSDTLTDRPPTSPSDRPSSPALSQSEPALVYTKKDICRLFKLSPAGFQRLKDAGKLPRELPRSQGGKLRYNAAEIRAWFAAGMPDQKTWEAMCKAKNGRR